MTEYNPDWKLVENIDLDTARSQVWMLIAARRYEREQAGTVAVDGIIVGTSREERASLAQAVSLGLDSQRRKLSDGSYAVLTASQLRAALAAATAAVQSLYDAEAAEVAALDHMSLDEILRRYP